MRSHDLLPPAAVWGERLCASVSRMHIWTNQRPDSLRLPLSRSDANAHGDAEEARQPCRGRLADAAASRQHIGDDRSWNPRSARELRTGEAAILEIVLQ